MTGVCVCACIVLRCWHGERTNGSAFVSDLYAPSLVFTFCNFHACVFDTVFSSYHFPVLVAWPPLFFLYTTFCM